MELLDLQFWIPSSIASWASKLICPCSSQSFSIRYWVCGYPRSFAGNFGSSNARQSGKLCCSLQIGLVQCNTLCGACHRLNHLFERGARAYGLCLFHTTTDFTTNNSCCRLNTSKRQSRRTNRQRSLLFEGLLLGRGRCYFDKLFSSRIMTCVVRRICSLKGKLGIGLTAWIVYWCYHHVHFESSASPHHDHDPGPPFPTGK